MRAHRRAVRRGCTGLVAALVCCAACADSTVPGSGPGTQSTGSSTQRSGQAATTQLRIMVVRAPTCAVERMDSPCPPAPVESARVTVLRDGSVVLRAATDDHGSTVVRVAPGHYVVQAAHLSALPGRAAKDVIVGASPASVTLVLDSGIR